MLSIEETMLRLAVAALLGSVIGLERERMAWAAGLRTHMLVCVGSTLMMIVSAYGFADALRYDHVALDPSRIAAQVVTGVGFLGAGTILLRHDSVRGLTTAASVWAVAGVGLAVGGGMYGAAIGATVLIFLILAVIKPLERRYWSGARQAHVITVRADREPSPIEAIEKLLSGMPLVIRSLDLGETADDDERQQVRIEVTRVRQSELIKALEKLSALDGVHRVTLGER
ncbi:MAG: MgtC/SapB family protein [Proteobacteria bacterium]|nr:MgtC/SapB family protein [Pseudomonadota bacterium]